MCLTYENGKMRPVETITVMGEEGIKRIMEGMIATMIYCKNICKCHHLPHYNNLQQQQKTHKMLEVDP
jgi:hypothetical protein